MATLRPLGVGSQVLTHGDRMAGFYGEANNIITADELRNIAGVTQGTPLQTGDIIWLKTSSNYKTLYIAKQPIQHSISWDHLQEKDLVFGKMIEIGNYVYLLRLIQGSNTNPIPAGNNTIGINSEWNNLIVQYCNIWFNGNDLGFSDNGRWSWCQEVYYSNINNRIQRGGTLSNVANLNPSASNSVDQLWGWRPVLELLYEK